MKAQILKVVYLIGLGEYSVALIMIAWGIWSILPWTNGYAQYPIFSLVTYYFPIWVIGTWMVIVGSLIMWAIHTNRPAWRLTGHALSCTVWIPWTSVLLLSPPPHAPGAIISFIYLLVHLCAIL